MDSSPDPLSARAKSKKINLDFCEIISPENSFRKTESAFRPAIFPEYLGLLREARLGGGFLRAYSLILSNKHRR